MSVTRRGARLAPRREHLEEPRLLTIGLTVVATLVTCAIPAILGNIQHDTSYMARWAFFLWFGTFAAGLWASAVWTIYN